jgi:putative glutamine amidotransferase
MSRPIIGLSSYLEPASWGAWNKVPAAVVQFAYVRHLQRAGARVVVLPPDTGDTDVLDALDGLVLAGGADVDARLYGAQPHATADVPRESRDASEIALYRGARDRDLPVLGICRGLQIMCVAEGGSLHQHLPDLVGDLKHRDQPGTFSEHEARFTAGSRIAEIFDTTSQVVNSSHHQSVADAGRLTVTGWAVDDTIEVCEAPGARFTVGVQWHPEVLDDPRLFDAFVAACRS